MNRNIELLMPAGNLEKLKIALLYGADACYIGYRKFSLRAQASNFDLKDIEEGVKFAHNLNKKVYITVNIIPREKDLDGLKEYLLNLEKIGVDGVIVSSPAILYAVKKYTKIHVSLSTQASSINSESVNFYNKTVGLERVVLGRECSIDEIRKIKENTTSELEIFIHGGMCSGYSGRCTLSNYMSNRDANRGGCAHSCRWDYDLYDEKRNRINGDNPFQMGSKDLIGIDYLKDLIEIGVDSLKIEGRMKSLHYVATIAYTYRMMIDDIINNTEKPKEYYLKLFESSENRENASGFLSGKNDESITLYSKNGLEANQQFLGMVIGRDEKKGLSLIELRNYFEKGDEVEIMSPGKPLSYSKILNIYDLDFNEVDKGRHALEKLYLKLEVKTGVNDIIRRKQ